MKPLNTIEQQETGDLELVHPKTGEGLRAFLVLAGPKHPVRERLELDGSRQLRKRFNKRGALELDDPEEDNRKALDFLVACTLGWYSLEDDPAPGTASPAVKRVDALDFGNGPEPFSVGRVREIYETKKLAWVSEQARVGLNKNDVFIRDSSRTSSATSAGSPGSPN